jgi:hypothetical protein
MFKERDFSIDEKIKILADLGFLGIHKEHKNAEIPHKKSKNKDLNSLEKEENKRQASVRVGLEHQNREFKIFRICSSKYRGKHKKYEENWQLVAAIVNLKKATRNLKYATF